MCVSTLEPMVLALDPLNTPVMEKVPVKVFHFPRLAKKGGNIASIKWSCKGEYACYQAARGYGYINGINKACLGDSSCFGAANNGGSINGISKACLTDSSCFYAANDGASIYSGIKNCVCDTCAVRLMTQVSLTSVVTN